MKNNKGNNKMSKVIEKITLNDILNLLYDNYQLLYIDGNYNLDNSMDIIQKCIEEKERYPLYTSSFEDQIEYSINAGINCIIEELKNDIISEFDISENEANELIEEYKYELTDHLREKDNNDYFRKVCENTRNINIRIELHSNFDCINSHHFECSTGGYEYKNNYFGDMVDTLYMNPKIVKQKLIEKGYNTVGTFPNLKYREGKEYVSYDSFIEELENSCCGANLLTFVGKLDLTELYDNNFCVNKIIIPTGNNCGLFSSAFGGGSILSMELKRDLKIDFTKHRKNKTKYDCFFMCIDEGYEYSINSVYGMTDSFFGDNITLID